MGKAKVQELARDAVESVQGEWQWKLTPREQALAIKAAERAAYNAVSLALIEERQN